MNKLTIIGNVVRDPKTRTVNTQTGTVNVCDFTVAVNDRKKKDANGQPEATFFNCTAWNKLADIVAKFAVKGTKVSVVGPVSARLYTTNDGAQRVSLDVTVEDFEFCSSRNDNAQQAAPAPAQAAPKQNVQQSFTAVTNEDLPF